MSTMPPRGVRFLARRIEPPADGRSHRREQREHGAALPRRGGRRQRPTRGPSGDVRWWERPAPGGHEALWAAVQAVHKRRQQLDVSITELARRLADRGHPITRETLSRVLNGKQPTSWATVQAMADILGADLPARPDDAR